MNDTVKVLNDAVDTLEKKPGSTTDTERSCDNTNNEKWDNGNTEFRKPETPPTAFPIVFLVSFGSTAALMLISKKNLHSRTETQFVLK